MTDINFKVDGNWTNAALAIYKVGAIYMSVDSTSPAILFGGTWVALEGRMLIGADNTYTAGSTGGSKTTILATVNLPAHTHTVPQHGHGFTQPTVNGGATTTGGGGSHSHTVNSMARVTNGTGTTGNGPNYTNQILLNRNDTKWTAYTPGTSTHNNHTHSQVAHTHTVTGGAVSDKVAFDTNETGSGAGFDTISPYLAVYMWKRTA